jgi:hypothetical protein
MSCKSPWASSTHCATSSLSSITRILPVENLIRTWKRTCVERIVVMIFEYGIDGKQTPQMNPMIYFPEIEDVFD